MRSLMNNNNMIRNEPTRKRLTDAELKQIIDFDELDKLLFTIDWSASDKVRKKSKRILKKYLDHPDARDVLPAVFAYLMFNTRRYDRLIQIHALLEDMNEVAFRVLMNVKYVCMGLQRKTELDEIVKRFPGHVRESLLKTINDIEEMWKRKQN
jgi:hypothetical protein